MHACMHACMHAMHMLQSASAIAPDPGALYDHDVRRPRMDPDTKDTISVRCRRLALELEQDFDICIMFLHNGYGNFDAGFPHAVVLRSTCVASLKS